MRAKIARRSACAAGIALTVILGGIASVQAAPAAAKSLLSDSVDRTPGL